LIAALACLAGSAMTLQLFNRSRRRQSDRGIWVVLSGIAGGTAIWTTHFVAMLGFNPPVEHAYEPVLTIASLFVAVGFTILGLHVATHAVTTCRIAFGGTIIGIGISVMHFTGMAGLDIAGYLTWDPTLVVASIAMGMLFGAMATTLEARAKTEVAKWGGFVCLVLAICSMHFTAMGAAEFNPDPRISVSVYAFSSELIAISIVAAMSVATGSALYVIESRSQREMLEGFRHASLHDPLTGLPNRAYLSTLLPDVLEQAMHGGTKVGVLVVDLDRFKKVNDVHGHEAGDAVLKGVSNRILDVLRADEFFARIGGDEFVAIVSAADAGTAACRLAERIEKSVCQVIVQKGQPLAVGVSIGIALFPDHGRDADDLLQSADLAMYRAKNSQDRKICTFDNSIDDARKDRSTLSHELKRALEQREFEIFYQPIVDVASTELVAFEALLRWKHPSRGTLPPGEFLSVAEDTGQIIPIGNWVLDKACRDAASWGGEIRVSVNIAAAQVYGQDLAKVVHGVLRDTRLRPDLLEIEMTEESIIGDPERALALFRELKKIGVSIAMDDYGTGYSSLANLRVFPFDKIKIDRAFISDVSTNPVSSAIVKSSLQLASDLGIPVVAEGVEDPAHLEFLRIHKCAFAQGYLFGRPAPISSLLKSSDSLGRQIRGKLIRNAAASSGSPSQLLSSR
jgi:diguanylate cyclase (GGDEF)-like protein